MKLLFIHGAGACGDVWHYQADHFRSCDAVTLPGRPEGELRSSVDEYRAWLHEYIVGEKYGTVILAGQSMGGAIALSYAIAHPGEIGGLVLIGTGARLRVNPDFLKTLSDNVDKPPSWYRGIVSPMYAGVEQSVRDMVLDRVCAFPVSVHLNEFLCCDRFDVMDKISSISTPVLIICGETDTMTPAKYSRYLADHIPGSGLKMVPGAGHMVFLEKPDMVNREIEDKFGGMI
jgi:pimeloyl-ACP methyl ester carboxylesterase